MRTQDIDDILRNRTEKRQLGFSKGNTFSTATFTIEEEPQVSLHTLHPKAFSHAASSHAHLDIAEQKEPTARCPCCCCCCCC